MIRHAPSRTTAAIVVLALALAACPADDPAPPDEPPDVEPAPVAFASVGEVLATYPEADAAALIRPVGDGQVRGYVLFQEVPEGLQVSVILEGLEPGRRGFHVHERGSCEPGPDGEPAGAAGPHFDPFGHPHGGPQDPPEERHVGDFGNLHVEEGGTVRVTFTVSEPELFDEAGIVSRALIVHAGEDDLETQPSGASGERIGCGVITAREA